MTIVTCAGGSLELPSLLLNDRADGGHLVVQPPRPVWDITALDSNELTAFSFLVSAAAQAMLDTLPQLEGGCINYWDAGNWALNEQALPAGPKRGPDARKLHLHLFGRNPRATNPSWMWGESPRFPRFSERLAFAALLDPLTEEECSQVGERTIHILRDKFGIGA
jgi:diadenosine tetraphosphate (Ap4A) HIT family hydrolase